MKILLDTDITSYLFRSGDERALAHFRNFSAGEVGISAITAAELTFGAELSGSPRHHTMIERIFRSLVVVSFDLAAAHAYARLRTVLQRRGTPIGPLDMLIAAHAISLDIPLATNNVREFRRVPGLQVENWLR
ncbi:MAG: PIN domain-containing protein [Reyranella sp.]|nr:PIN domain-containing protein [Reyranella sp.]